MCDEMLHPAEGRLYLSDRKVQRVHREDVMGPDAAERAGRSVLAVGRTSARTCLPDASTQKEVGVGWADGPAWRWVGAFSGRRVPGNEAAFAESARKHICISVRSPDALSALRGDE